MLPNQSKYWYMDDIKMYRFRTNSEPVLLDKLLDIPTDLSQQCFLESFYDSSCCNL